MNKNHGRFGSLPQRKFSYQQFIKKVSLVLAWVMMLFGASSSAMAFNADGLASFLAAADPQEKAQPRPAATPAHSALNSMSNPALELPTDQLGLLLTTVSPEVVRPELKESGVTSNPTGISGELAQSAPEITMEVIAAEYIAPVVATQPVIPSSIGGVMFPYGQCTYYVATRRTVTWSGNAGQWYGNARAQGYAVGSTPQSGAIMVSYEGVSLGHVSYVESVNADGSFIVSEMNYNGGWGRISSRTVVPGTIYIVGFIY